jgi:hypothetical protein
MGGLDETGLLRGTVFDGLHYFIQQLCVPSVASESGTSIYEIFRHHTGYTRTRPHQNLSTISQKIANSHPIGLAPFVPRSPIPERALIVPFTQRSFLLRERSFKSRLSS